MNAVSQPGPRLSSLDVRRRWPFFLLFVPFLASILGAYAWFNTDEIRSQKPEVSTDLRPPTSGL